MTSIKYLSFESLLNNEMLNSVDEENENSVSMSVYEQKGESINACRYLLTVFNSLSSLI